MKQFRLIKRIPGALVEVGDILSFGDDYLVNIGYINTTFYYTLPDMEILQQLGYVEEVAEEFAIERYTSKPTKGEYYFTFNRYGEIDKWMWDEDLKDKFNFGLGNCFKTHDGAYEGYKKTMSL